MPEISEFTSDRRAVSDRLTAKTENHRLCVVFSKALLCRIDQFRQEVKEKTGRSISRAYVVRSGIPLLLRHLRVQMTKASKGTLHAKPRPEAFGVSTARKGTNTPKGVKANHEVKKARKDR